MGIIYNIIKYIGEGIMKFFAVILISVAIITLLCGEYEVDLRHGVFRFSSEEEAVESGIASEFQRKGFKNFKLDDRVETFFGDLFCYTVLTVC